MVRLCVGYSVSIFYNKGLQCGKDLVLHTSLIIIELNETTT